jgi:hypothetical protein
LLPLPSLSKRGINLASPPLNDEFNFVASQEKKQSLIDELQGKRDRAVVRTWRGAIQVPLPNSGNLLDPPNLGIPRTHRRTRI